MAATERTSGRAASCVVGRARINFKERGGKREGGERMGEDPMRTFSAVQLALSSADPFLGKQDRARVLPARIRVNDLCSLKSPRRNNKAKRNRVKWEGRHEKKKSQKRKKKAGEHKRCKGGREGRGASRVKEGKEKGRMMAAHRTDEKGERVEDVVWRDLDRQFGDALIRIGGGQDRDL